MRVILVTYMVFWGRVLIRRMIPQKALRCTRGVIICCALAGWFVSLIPSSRNNHPSARRPRVIRTSGPDSKSVEEEFHIDPNSNLTEKHFNARNCQPKSSQSKLILFWSTLLGSTNNWNDWHDFTGNLKLCKKRCHWTTDRGRIKEASLVIFSMYNSDLNRSDTPQYRREEQLWAIFSQESPISLGRSKLNYDVWNGLFNLTVVTRLDADIPAVHGKIMKKKDLDSQVKVETNIGMHSDMALKNRRGAAVISNCSGSSLRLQLIREIKNYFPIDVYGRCGNNSCAPGKSTHHCYSQLAPRYSFVMSFENSMCRDYITKKFFSGLLYPWIPVVWGGGNYKKVAPEWSYVDARMFGSIKELAVYLKYLANNPSEYLKYFNWKKDYVVSAPEASFVCDICGRLHSPRPAQSYENLYKWWVKDSHCIPDPARIKDAFSSRSSFRNRLQRLAST